MKTVEDLKRLREKLQAETQVRRLEGIRIIVGMGTCGIAAGAREVMAAALDEIAKRDLQAVTVQQTGCIGMCEKEVLVDVVRPSEPRITYGNVKPEDIATIVSEHIIKGNIVEELVIGKIAE